MYRHGKKWTADEDRQLVCMYNKYDSYGDMGKKLHRTWFACKCRLIRLGVVKDEMSYNGWSEAYKIPKDFEEKLDISVKIADSVSQFINMFGNCIPCGCEECKREGKLTADKEELTKSEIYTDEFTFSTQELDIVRQYLECRLAKVCTELAKNKELASSILLHSIREHITDELGAIRNLMKMTLPERRKVCKKL